MIWCLCSMSLYLMLSICTDTVKMEFIKSHFEDHYSPLMKVTFAFIKKIDQSYLFSLSGVCFPTVQTY